MTIPRILPIAAGAVALLATSAILIVHVISTGHLPEPARVRTAAIVSASLEGLVLSVLAWLFSTYYIVSTPERSRRFLGIAFGVSILVCTLATVSSVITLISLNSAAQSSTGSVLGSKQTKFMIGSAVALGLAFASQIGFIVTHFVFARLPSHGAALSLHTNEEEEEARQPRRAQLKSIPYHATIPYPRKEKGEDATPLGSSLSPSVSSSGRSATETLSSIRGSISSIARPLSTRRLLTREKSAASSAASNGQRERVSAADEGFDSWDTSSVDPQNRQTVLQSSSPTGRFLETIPASPTTSRTPSVIDPVDLEPPARTRNRNRSRSYSPAGPYFATASDSSEAHIHPLFRSDSPNPPPVATPGTVVMASPNAGQVVSDRQSIRSLSRMRSGSLPGAPSPLGRQGSREDFFSDFTPLRPAARETSPEASILEAADEAEDGPERRLTPPIPDWIMSAGARGSWTGYNRRLRNQESRESCAGETGPGGSGDGRQ
ncbi:uncharacterized protein DNG_07261 [Cephalotrichum gorgonifer]|uniref:Uncharacterized protein n=1 Tax=Cephalotrichum gorgonifer TaxID=2041049 RepID=A0AAE8SX83_9PEZI|nr:uncharacterized protein DNG_07261 [Cephalotrichum gorgonifer]